MRFSRPGRPSPALVVAVIALVVAMGGTGYAALKLPKNSVGSAQIKANSVTSSKVKDGSLTGGDFKTGQLPAGAPGRDGAPGPAGAPGPQGDSGRNGADGARGPSDGYQATGAATASGSNSAAVTVPAGDYLVTSSGMGFNEGVAGAFPNYDGEMHCALTSANDGTHNVGTFATVPKRGYNAVGTDAGGTMNVTLTSGFHLPSGGTVTVTCDDAQYSEQKPLTYSNIHITAVQVATLHP